ncbi:MAG: hypothetical protein NC925_03505 [Candidatus Omnitrophica bacterium]|nr:hypothetical protein [Candidatus Omnitrophota bacterium]MCM8832157.1 hypothetical protein [Candidatus Omnitrophota bacterium]
MKEKPINTPEKELLNLIEGSHSNASVQTTFLQHQRSHFFSLPVLKSKFSFLKKNVKKNFVFDIKLINFLLKCLNLILFFYLILNLAQFIFPYKEKKAIIDNLKSQPNIEYSKTPPMLSILKAPSYYLEKARERDIFSREKKKITKSMLAEDKPSLQILELTKDLKLVGISWSADPDVIIEDTATKQTFFLKKGQLIANKIRLKAVFKDKVILSYMGEEVELR